MTLDFGPLHFTGMPYCRHISESPSPMRRPTGCCQLKELAQRSYPMAGGRHPVDQDCSVPRRRLAPPGTMMNS